MCVEVSVPWIQHNEVGTRTSLPGLVVQILFVIPACLTDLASPVELVVIATGDDPRAVLAG